ncbi:MAG: peptidoglycan recognition family protein [Synechococcaceae cyanobacterium]|nr:peptidoglycan recognition family protein [Synechococcaceae cyanobacterium]
MNLPLRPLVTAMAGAAVLGSGGLLWLARDLFASPSNAGGRPSLLEILEEVRLAPPTLRRPRPAPPPPQQAAWSPPLQRSCPAVDPALRARLEALRADLPRTRARIPIHPTNFGPRFRRDAFGNRVDPTPRVVVLHETVYGIGSAINTFRTPHPRDEDQVSYHTLIGQDGLVVDTLDPALRAFGAGYSAFAGEWVVTNPEVGGSINNFALHLSLETPLDGEDAEKAHSGYTAEQYDALAVVLTDWMQRYPIGPEHITTHRAVDLGGARADPRSFDWEQLRQRMVALGTLC